MPLPADPPRAAGIVLAAGASRRMGENKMLLQLDGEPLARRAARHALEAGLDPVMVVVGRDAAEVRAALADLPCETVVNESFSGPSSTSLHLALEALPPTTDAAVVILGDMIEVTSTMIRAVADAATTSPAPLVVSRYGDVTAPPLLFRRALFPELLAWTGEGCGKAVVQRHATEASYVEWPPAALTDVDTHEDLLSVLGHQPAPGFNAGQGK
jgi:molybdenum cofactor cytidylyltransferase